MGTEAADWAALKKIEALADEALQAHRELIERVAAQVSVATDAPLTMVVQRSRAAIKEGSARLMVAITGAQSAYAAGDVEGAKRMLQQALAAEPLRYYREILTAELGRRS